MGNGTDRAGALTRRGLLGMIGVCAVTVARAADKAVGGLSDIHADRRP